MTSMDTLHPRVRLLLNTYTVPTMSMDETLVTFRSMCTVTAGDGSDVPEMQARVCVCIRVRAFAVNLQVI